MTFIAPDVVRSEPASSGDELTSLYGWLGFYRDSLRWKCAGLTEEQLRIQSCPPSNMSLLGIVRHMTDVERVWFQRRIGGSDAPNLYWTDADPDADFTEVDGADAAANFEAFIAECAQSRATIVGRDLAEVVRYIDKRGVPSERDIRWIVTHMIEEYARHLGHCDLLRERIDGATGY